MSTVPPKPSTELQTVLAVIGLLNRVNGYSSIELRRVTLKAAVMMLTSLLEDLEAKQ